MINQKCNQRLPSGDDVRDVDDFTPVNSPQPIPGEVYCHEEGSVEDWEIDVKSNTRVVMICDQSWGRVRDLEEGWEAHIYPYLDIGDAAMMIHRIRMTEALTTVVVAAGIGNRLCEPEVNYDDIEQLKYSILQKGLTGIFVAATGPPDLDHQEQMNLNGLNACAAVLFNHQFCVIDYPTTMNDTAVDEACNQPMADLFIEKITMFENWLRVIEVMDSDEDDVEY